MAFFICLIVMILIVTAIVVGANMEMEKMDIPDNRGMKKLDLNKTEEMSKAELDALLKELSDYTEKRRKK